MPALCVRFGTGRAQPLIGVRKPRLFLRVNVRLVLRDLAPFLLAGQVGGEGRKLLVAGLPQGAQLKKNQRSESGFWVPEETAPPLHLFLESSGAASPLLS